MRSTFALSDGCISSRITERRSAASFSSVDSSSGKSTTSLIGMMSCRSSSRRARIFSTARLVDRIAAVASSLLYNTGYPVGRAGVMSSSSAANARQSVTGSRDATDADLRHTAWREVGEETGDLDTMLYKVADNYDEEVAVLTESLTSLMEPLLIIFLGGAVGFIVVALFLPLIKLIQDLS